VCWQVKGCIWPSALPVLGVDASLLRLASAARLLHLARHASTLRVVSVVGRKHDESELGKV
jgi:hypothetical protein